MTQQGRLGLNNPKEDAAEGAAVQIGRGGPRDGIEICQVLVDHLTQILFRMLK